MKWEDIVRKLTSRKFWAAVADFVSMLMIAMGSQESETTKITALILAGGGLIAYIVGEGLADAARAKAPQIVLSDDVSEEEHPPEADANG